VEVWQDTVFRCASRARRSKLPRSPRRTEPRSSVV